MEDSAAGRGGRVVALIPAYNAERHLAQVVAEARSHLSVLVVDDGSTDDTAAVAERAGAAVLRQRPNQGKGAALKAGMRRLLAEDCAAVLTLDADGQHDPAEIPKFVDVFHTRGADLIIGARNFDEMPPVRRASNEIGRRAFSWAVGRYIPDNQSGYRLLSRRLVEAVLESAEPGYEFEMDMIVICLKRGYTLDWVPIRTIYADEVSHIRPLQHVQRFFRMVRQARRRMRQA